MADVFDSEVVPMLRASPQLRPVAIWTELLRRHPDLNPNTRRTLERRVRSWKAEHGPDREVIFRQDKEPGRLGISDFTAMDRDMVTIDGQPLKHMLYHFRLPWSGYTHAEVVVGGESFMALQTGLQNALWVLGGTPHQHRTDSLSAAFKNLNRDAVQDLTGRYRQLCRDYGMVPSRNNKGMAHENGAIESSHGHLKRTIADALALRGSNDFDAMEGYHRMIAEVVGAHNARARKAIQTERSYLNKLPSRRHKDYDEVSVRVVSTSGFTLRKVFYSVPSRLIGHRLKVRIFTDHLEVFLGNALQLTLPRRIWNREEGSTHVVNYRHVIHSLKTKPGALMRLVYRDELFPREAYRRCFEVATEQLGERRGCRLVVQLLALAHEDNCEAALATEIETCLAAGKLPDLEGLRSQFAPNGSRIPEVVVTTARLASYGALLGQGEWS